MVKIKTNSEEKISSWFFVEISLRSSFLFSSTYLLKRSWNIRPLWRPFGLALMAFWPIGIFPLGFCRFLCGVVTFGARPNNFFLESTFPFSSTDLLKNPWIIWLLGGLWSWSYRLPSFPHCTRPDSWNI
jgi:hypothetical protein